MNASIPKPPPTDKMHFPGRLRQFHMFVKFGGAQFKALCREVEADYFVGVRYTNRESAFPPSVLLHEPGLSREIR